MSFLDHLEELRTRLIRCALAVAAGMAVAFYFIEHLVNFVLEPARLALPKGTTLVFTQSGEGFPLNERLREVCQPRLALAPHRRRTFRRGTREYRERRRAHRTTRPCLTG
jgi:hypothetical protein